MAHRAVTAGRRLSAPDAGQFPDPPRFAHGALVAGGVVLGLLTIALILAD